MINKDFFDLIRFPSHEVIIGNRPVGGKNPIRLQSMTNTPTLDIEATVAQSIKIIEAGADYVRISAPNIKATEALKEIKTKIRAAGFSHPLVADIHFNADVALLAARYVEKVRINPGNYVGSSNRGIINFSDYETEREKEDIYQKLKPLVAICKNEGTAIRIGTNLGSLSARIISKYGNTPRGMVEATYEFLEIFKNLDFHQLIISLKASKPLIMIQAYEGMVEKMLEKDMSYPLHIGITEAGEGENGRIKSALGICSLLNKGIGDTLRVSLTEAPEAEIPFAMKLSSVYQVPFTQTGKMKEYQLKKSDFMAKDITLTSNRYHAVVIDDQTGNIDNKSSKTQSDFAYIPNPDKHLTSHKWILTPYNVWKKDRQSNYFPVFQLSENLNDFSGLEMVEEPVIVSIPCRQIDWIEKLKNKINVRGIILELTLCRDEVNLEAWVKYSQIKGIPLILRKSFQSADIDEIINHFAIFAGNILVERKCHGIWLDAPDCNEDLNSIAFGFLQSAGLRITRTEFISCPTCARTSYDLQKVLKDVQKHTSKFPGLKIAVMGCIVNGPGEMADADFGFVGTGAGKLHLYQGKNPVKKNIDPANASNALLDILKKNGYNI
jgi:(E)-4-hydroxy-3-methylbut-2-enyl-diphosphate synthase